MVLGSSNTDGVYNTTVSANTTSGFRWFTIIQVVQELQSMGHGLGSAPELIITNQHKILKVGMSIVIH